MEPVLLIDKLASMINYFETSIKEEDNETLRNYGCAMAMVDLKDVNALQTMVKVLQIVENNPKIRKMVMDKYVDE